MRLLFIDYNIAHLFDDADYPVGGWAVELRGWLAGFRAIGVDTAIVTSASASLAAEDQGETTLLRVYAPRGRIPGATYLFRFLPDMLRAARAFRPDVVIQAVAGTNTGLMWMLSRILSVPFVYRCANDIDVNDRVKERLSKVAVKLFSLGFARADGYVAQNGYQLDAIRRRYPAKPAIVLHNPYLARNDGPPPPRAARGYVAWLGVFQPQKNVPLLARIAAAMPDTEFHVGGRSELVMRDRATLDALEKLKQLPNVTLVGYLKRTQVPAFLSGAIALLSTSHYEGFSNTFLEAWGAGTPMVAPDAVDPDGLIATRGLGRAVADPERLVEALGEIVALPASGYDSLAAHCRDYVVREHDPERLATAMRDFLQNLKARR